MVAISLSIRVIGQEETVVVDKSVGFVGNAFFDFTASFTTGNYEVIARAREATGFFTEDVLSFTVNAAPTVMLDPYFRFIAGNRWGNSIPNGQRKNTKIYCDQDDAVIQYAFGPYGVAAPTSSWATYTTGTVDSISLAFPFGYPYRIFLRATHAPSTVSATNYADCAGRFDI